MIKNGIILLLLLFFIFLTPVCSADDVRWISKGTYTLYSGDMITAGDFEIEAYDFDAYNALVCLNIYKNGSIVEDDVSSVGDTLIYDDEIKVEVINTTGDVAVWENEKEDPKTEIKIYLRAVPELVVSIDTYVTDEITATITIRNRGEQDIEDVKVNINADGMEVIDGKLTYHFDEILKSQSETITIRLKTPSSANKPYNISVDVTGVDENGIYTASSSKTIRNAESTPDATAHVQTTAVHVQTISITKSVNPAIVVIGDCVTVILGIHNQYDSQAEVHVADDLPANVDLINGTTSESLILQEGATQNHTYTIKMNSAGDIVLPPATVNFTDPQGCERKIVSKKPVVSVINPVSAAPLPENTQESVAAPGFGGTALLLALILVLIVSGLLHHH